MLSKMSHWGRCFIALFFVLSLSLAEAAADKSVVAGKVESVLTGDIFTMMTEAGLLYVRLAGIDTPDMKQTYGKESQQALANLILHKVIVIRAVGVDPCNRSVAMAWLNGDNGLDISSRLVSGGAAWVYRPYSDSQYLLLLEQKARREKQGLWALESKDRVPPWEWRKEARKTGYESNITCRGVFPEDQDGQVSENMLQQPSQASAQVVPPADSTNSENDEADKANWHAGD